VSDCIGDGDLCLSVRFFDERLVGPSKIGICGGSVFVVI